MTYTDILFGGPPSHESGRFVEVEDATGKSVRLGEWVQRADGYWALRIAASPQAIEAVPDLLNAMQGAYHALRSYQYGNASTELAQKMADTCAAALARAGHRPTVGPA